MEHLPQKVGTGAVVAGAHLPQKVGRGAVRVEHQRVPLFHNLRFASAQRLNGALHLLSDDADDKGVREEANHVREIEHKRRLGVVFHRHFRSCMRQHMQSVAPSMYLTDLEITRRVSKT